MVAAVLQAAPPLLLSVACRSTRTPGTGPSGKGKENAASRSVVPVLSTDILLRPYWPLALCLSNLHMQSALDARRSSVMSHVVSIPRVTFMLNGLQRLWNGIDCFQTISLYRHGTRILPFPAASSLIKIFQCRLPLGVLEGPSKSAPRCNRLQFYSITMTLHPISARICTVLSACRIPVLVDIAWGSHYTVRAAFGELRCLAAKVQTYTRPRTVE